MREYTCPNCRGSFPKVHRDDEACPWCDQPLDGSYEPEDEVGRTIQRTDDDYQPGLLDLFRS